MACLFRMLNVVLHNSVNWILPPCISSQCLRSRMESVRVPAAWYMEMLSPKFDFTTVMRQDMKGIVETLSLAMEGKRTKSDSSHATLST